MEQKKQYKKTVLIDLDGVLNEYDGNFNKDRILNPKKGAAEFLDKLSAKYDLRLFTTRNRIIAAKWLIKHSLDKYFSDITNVKELSYLIIDDKCLTFNGNYDELLKNIEEFKPWWHKEK